MGDYSNDVRRTEQAGHLSYFKEVDGIIRQNARRLVAEAGGGSIFNGDIYDGVVVVNVDLDTAQYNLPPINQVKPDQEIRVCVVDPNATGNPLAITTQDPLNEVAGPHLVVISVPPGQTSTSRKFQRVENSWYLVCCLQGEEPPIV